MAPLVGAFAVNHQPTKPKERIMCQFQQDPQQDVDPDFCPDCGHGLPHQGDCPTDSPCGDYRCCQP